MSYDFYLIAQYKEYVAYYYGRQPKVLQNLSQH